MRGRALPPLLVALALVLVGCAQPVPDDGATSEQDDGLDGADDGGDVSGGGDSAGGSGDPGDVPPGGTVAGPSGSGGQPPPPGAPPPPPGSMTGTGTTSPSGTSSSGTGVFYDVPQAVHQAAWLCQTPIQVDDLRPAGTDNQECQVTLTFSSTQVTVVSTGIPNHDYDSGGGCCATEQSLSNVFPLRPEMASTTTPISQRGAIAIAVNGVPIFSPEDSNDADVVIATYTSDAEPRLEMCDAHSEPNSGTYHYHADANCIHWHAGAGEDWYDYDFSKVDATVHSKIVGFAKDGFPIYGSYGYAADNVTIREITSSYRLKTGATGANGIDDQEYVAGLGDLDECNGRFGKTPEFPNGIYHYYSTKHNGAGSWGFPYFPLCYKGVVASGGTTSGTGDMGGTGGTPPPPSGSQSSSTSMTGAPPPGGQCPPPGMPPPPGGCPPPP